MLCCKQRPTMSNVTNWMEDDDNDFEMVSCLDACGKLLRSKCSKPASPLLVSERVADVTLSADHFDVHQTFRHGLPHQPSCLAYDSEQQLLAIGSHQGEITIIGKAGLEKHLELPDAVAVEQMVFVEEQGLLVTRCSNGILYQWELRDKHPRMKNSLEVDRSQRPNCISWSKSTPSQIYVGMDDGNVHLLRTDTFQRTSHSVFKDNVMACLKVVEDVGEVVDVSMHPSDPTKLLIGYEQLVVIWNHEKSRVDKKYQCLDDDPSSTVTSLCWKGDQNHFAVSYSNGSVLTYSCRSRAPEKPKEKIVPHMGNAHSISPCEQVQYFNKNSDSWLLFSGGYPEGRMLGVRTLTIYYEQNSTAFTPQLLSFADPITSFVSLSPPLGADKACLGTLAVLTSKDLFVHDLLAPEVPLFQLPHALDFNISPVTCVQLCGNCPDDFMAKLQSFQSKMKDENFSTRPWPLKGGQWGEESPDLWSDLLVTGHMDGSVRFWYCRSVQMQFLFTINTTNYFKQRHRRERASVVSLPSPQSVPLPRSSSVEDNCFFAIHTIEMDVHAQSLCVVNGGGHVLTLDFIKRPPCFSGRGSSMKTNSLPVDFSRDSLIMDGETEEEVLSPSAVPPSQDFWHFRSDSPHAASVFCLLQHCRCFYSEGGQRLPVVVTAVRYSSDTDLLAIGSNLGLAIVNTSTSSCVKILSCRTSLFYAADPEKYQWELSQERSTSKRTGINHFPERSSSLPSIVDSRLVEECEKIHSLREQFFPLLQNSLPSSITSSLYPRSSKENHKRVRISCLNLVQLTLSKESAPVLTLWVGTLCGHVLAYNIVTMAEIDLKSSGIIQNQRSPVISLFFVNDRGDKLLTPFKRRNEFSSAKDRCLKSLFFPRLNKTASFYQSHASYVIITTHKRIESMAFPGCLATGHSEPYMAGGEMLRSGFFSCEGLPCLLNLTSSGDILIHGLPKLQHLITVPYAPLLDSRALHTFQVSGDGQALHFVSPSEVQRLSITSDDHLNLPHCLPELLQHTKKRGSNTELMKGVAEQGDRMKSIFKASVSHKALH